MMKMIAVLAAIAAMGSCASCGTGNDDPAPVVVPAKGKELCPQTCSAMNNKLTNEDGGVGCEEGTPILAPPDILSCQGDSCPELVECAGADAGAKECVTCEWYCEYAHDQGSYWNTSCIVNDITACAEIESVCNTQ
jgi:hypothetical protein